MKLSNLLLTSLIVTSSCTTNTKETEPKDKSCQVKKDSITAVNTENRLFNKIKKIFIDEKPERCPACGLG